MASSVAAGKKGVRDFLRVSEGLRTSDSVTVRSADLAPEEMGPAIAGGLVLLGSVTVSHTQAGLQGRAETVTVSCWAIDAAPGQGEDAIDTARDRADQLLTLVEAALAADPSAAGTIPPPGRVEVTSGGLEESPVSWDGAAARRADRSFSLSWTSHS